MKHVFFLVSMIAIMSLTSCEKLKQLVNYDVPLEMQYTLTIPASAASDDIIIPPVTYYYDVNKAIESYTKKTGIGKINSVKLTAASIIIPESSQYEDDNLTALSKLAIQFNSGSNSNWVHIVNLASPPAEKYAAALPVNDDLDFKSYFDSNDFNFKATAGLSRATTKEVRCTILLNVSVNVSL